MNQRIILIGFMGAGKTTLGKKLATRLNFSFIDTDKLIEKQQNCSVSEIFSSKGEDFFRKLEKKILDEIELSENIVVAVGGGLPCFSNNMEKLKQLGICIYLQRPIRELIFRVLLQNNQRPLLAGKTDEELENYMQQLLEIREPIYLQAHIIADREHQTIEKLLELIHDYQKNQ